MQKPRYYRPGRALPGANTMGSWHVPQSTSRRFFFFSILPLFFVDDTVTLVTRYYTRTCASVPKTGVKLEINLQLDAYHSPGAKTWFPDRVSVATA